MLIPSATCRWDRQHINDIAQEILKAEGGFVNDPNDPGGPINNGVTLKTLKRLGYDLNQDGRVDIADLKQLSSTQAVQIFVQDYFYKPQIDQLLHMLHAPVFDIYVNAGSHAVKVLQRTLILFDMDITVDGVIGPITIAATQTAARCAPDHLVDVSGIERVNCYLSLTDARPNLRKFARTRRGNKGGWIKRAEKYMRPRFHLSPSVFQQRTAAWG
jgi:lysozyme family protein